jgi:alpha-L-rhamnosidase
MNSFNHCAFGAVGEWIWRNVAGLNPDPQSPGYKHFVVRPRPGGGLTCSKAAYDSVRGRIGSHWTLDGVRFTLHITVPPNTSATVIMPQGAKYEIGSGEYTFSEP